MIVAEKSAPANQFMDLDKYAGPWSSSEVKHLLRRALYGPPPAMIEAGVSMGMIELVELLLTDMELPDPPINYNYADDPEVPIGTTWVGRQLSDPMLDFYRRRSLRAWTIGLGLNQGMSLREKMYLFWHNHFAISDTNNAAYEFGYADLLRTHALGNFKKLVKEMTVNPAMLRYLNGNQNTVLNPNENYARELLELFTIGKGDQIAPGDYTHYTEHDVLEIAKVLTGWRDVGYAPRANITEPFALFLDRNHDQSIKTLSSKFNFAVIQNNGSSEYEKLIDIIFEQEEVSRFITRKIYRWFVYHEIDEGVEMMIIEPLAEILREADYEIKPVLKALFTSAHFYEDTFRGAIIKSPLDYTLAMVNELEKRPSSNSLEGEFRFYNAILRVCEFLEQVPFDLPDVAGWKAYYQEPQYYQTWINSSTMQFRKVFREMILEGRVNLNGTLRQLPGFQADLLNYVDQLDQPAEPNSLIDELVQNLLPQDISDGQKSALKEVLLPGLPDYEWTVEYNDYLSNPQSEVYAAPIRNKLIELFKALTAMPEYYVF